MKPIRRPCRPTVEALESRTVPTTLHVHGTTLTEKFHTHFTAQVATITTSDTAAKPADFKATLDWGDGSVTSGKVVAIAGKPGQFTVNGAHTYDGADKQIVQVTVRRLPGSVTATADTTVHVSGTSFLIEATPKIRVNEGEKVPDATFAVFAVPGLAKGAKFTATLQWEVGDELVHATAKVTANSGGKNWFAVHASPTFDEDDDALDVQITVKQAGGPSFNIVTFVKVLEIEDMPVHLAPGPIQVQLGDKGDVTLLSFIDSDAKEDINSISCYNANVSWGGSQNLFSSYVQPQFFKLVKKNEVDLVVPVAKYDTAGTYVVYVSVTRGTKSQDDYEHLDGENGRAAVKVKVVGGANLTGGLHGFHVAIAGKPNDLQAGKGLWDYANLELNGSRKPPKITYSVDWGGGSPSTTTHPRFDPFTTIANYRYGLWDDHVYKPTGKSGTSQVYTIKIKVTITYENGLKSTLTAETRAPVANP